MDTFWNNTMSLWIKFCKTKIVPVSTFLSHLWLGVVESLEIFPHFPHPGRRKTQHYHHLCGPCYHGFHAYTHIIFMPSQKYSIKITHITSYLVLSWQFPTSTKNILLFLCRCNNSGICYSMWPLF